VNNLYFKFLCELVGRSSEYESLLRQLSHTSFYPLVNNDDNRGEDGLHLREMFSDEEGRHALSISQKGPCTLLEMLIGLSYRLEFELAQSKFEKTVSQWFWILIDNLRLSDMTEERFQAEKVDEILTRFLNRDYKPHGDGGLFPLKNPKNDQRNTEIWYQMTEYIIENYPTL